jgi:hypothetical protein
VAQARRIVFGVTAAIWLGLCALVFWGLVRRAAEAAPATIEEYARAPSFQVLNFVVGYFPILVLLLAVLLGVEYVALRIVERRQRNRAKRFQGV